MMTILEHMLQKKTKEVEELTRAVKQLEHSLLLKREELKLEELMLDVLLKEDGELQ